MPPPAAQDDFRGDWHREVRYDLLIRHPEVREHLARAANHKVFRLSAEQSIKVYDKFVAKAVGGVAVGDQPSHPFPDVHASFKLISNPKMAPAG